MTDRAVAVREEKALTVKEQRREAIMGQVVAQLPSLVKDPRRFEQVTVIALAKNPELLECDPGSVIMAVLEAAEAGLEPTGSIGGAHLVPFNEKVQGTNQKRKVAKLIHDYRGTQRLIRDGGGGEVKAVLVYEGDHFKVHEGSQGAWIEHEPAYQTTDPTKIRFVYAYIIGMPEKFEVMTKEQIDAVRASSRLSNGVPWTQHYGQQARKTVIKRFANYLELKPEQRQFIERDTEHEFTGPPSESVPSRTAEVKRLVQGRVRGKGPLDEPVEQDTTPTQEPTAAADDADQGTADNQPASVKGVCGVNAPKSLDENEPPCVLEQGHAFADGKASAHQDENGSRWAS